MSITLNNFETKSVRGVRERTSSMLSSTPCHAAEARAAEETVARAGCILGKNHGYYAATFALVTAIFAHL